ncbi:UvrD-helicase domain-containing protein [Oligella urethralis]|uniref:UvrD-helicase domain-containing protein n=1 Tax=Oligella urethralis TaxID=90245 RepID=UPI00058B9E25|nr:UvrD-helicase domain-containing protein [Oligella urethralis]
MSHSTHRQSSEHSMGLNAMQLEAVKYLDGPCLVLAGAGSGKTRVITQKIAYLINTCGYNARGVLALTFTNKAAKEMMERLKSLVEPSLIRDLTVCTFHALGVRFLREEAKFAGLKRGFSILDATDAAGIIQEMLSTTDKGRIRAVQQVISLWKNQLILPEQAENLAQTPDEQDAARLYRSYEATLKAYQAVDFDDLILLPVLLMREHEEVRERWQQRITYLLVDEYQDTNACQYEWLKLLTDFRQQFTAVGDDDQAIYAWRGATVENLSRLLSDYPKLKLIKLEQNYRSVGRILEAANNVIANNPSVFSKKLWSSFEEGSPVQVVVMDNDQAEAETVAMRITQARFQQRADWKDFAVLYRGNHQARVIEQAFREMHIPYVLTGGQSFFDKAEVRDILAYLRLLVNEEDDPAFIRAVTTPKRGIGQATLTGLGELAAAKEISLYEAIFEDELINYINEKQLQALRAFAHVIESIRWQANRGRAPARAVDLLSNPALYRSEERKAPELLDELMRFIDYERYLYDSLEERSALSRWQNVQELLSWLKTKAVEEEMDLLQLVQRIALITMLERSEDEEEIDAVKLSTIHASKGLEYPYVHLIGTEEGLLPHLGKDDEYGDPNKEDGGYSDRIQEERRLMYVAITRAQKHLTVTWCKKRRRAREDIICEPSRFIAEMGLDSGVAIEKDPFQGMSPKERLARLRDMLTQKK